MSPTFCFTINSLPPPPTTSRFRFARPQDFYFDLTEDGRVISPRDYLEEALRPFPGSNPAVKAKNMVG